MFHPDEVTIIHKDEYRKWAYDQKNAFNYFARTKITAEDKIYICAGITDPKKNFEELNIFNFQLPKNILEIAEQFGPEVITFGSVLENLESENEYIKSKTRLFKYLRDQSMYRNFKHWQLHTLYGTKPPKPQMFLGQISRALKENNIFIMSSGLQLREYWHSQDVVRFILSSEIINSKTNQIEIVGCGSPLTLKEVAEGIFEYFNRVDLLRLGVLLDPVFDNYSFNFKTKSSNPTKFMREPLSGVCNYLNQNME
jgi:nucleoside-diphosphate-sugar epimerase